MTASTRSALSREVIARTALAMTEHDGLAGLSMRKLGSELGIEAMSLYHYIENKDDLLDAMLDCLYVSIELPVDTAPDDWEGWSRQGLRAFHRVLVSHAAALHLFANRPARTAEAFEVLLFYYRRFQHIGLDVERASKAVHFGVSFVMGHVASELGSLALLRQGVGQAERANLADPTAAEIMTKTSHLTAEDRFEAGLDLVVAGLRSLYGLP